MDRETMERTVELGQDLRIALLRLESIAATSVDPVAQDKAREAWHKVANALESLAVYKPADSLTSLRCVEYTDQYSRMFHSY